MSRVAVTRLRARTFLAATLLTLLFVESLRAFFSATYYHNLTTLGINASALVVLLALSPLILLAARPAWLLPASVATLALARVGMSLTWGGALYLPLAGLAVAAALLALPLLAWRGDHGEVAIGFTLAWALDAALVYLGGSFDPTARLQGLYLAVPAGLGALALVWPERSATAVSPARRGLAAGAALGAWIFLEHAILASPSAMARWNTLPTLPLAALSVVGLVAPLVLWYKVRAPRWVVIALNAALLVALLDHVFLHTGWLLLVALLPAQAALAVDLAIVLPKAGAGAWALAAGVMLILHFGVALSLTFAYVPPSALWKGSELWLLPIAGILAALPALLASRAPPRDAPVTSSAPPRGWRNLPALIAVAAIMLAALGAASPRAAITEPPAGAPLRVLTFNLHQGFDNDGVVDPDDFVQVLLETSPEIVALQESDTTRVTSANLDMVGYLAAHTGYRAVYGPATSAESFGVSLLSRYPIAESHVVSLPSTKDNRYFIEARLNVSGKDVWMYVVHLGLPAQDREDETTVLLQHVESRRGPAIIAGDFNSCPHVVCPDYDGRMDTVYDTMAAKFVDTYKITAASHNESDPAAFTYEAQSLTHRIDYVWVTPEFVVHDAKSVTSAAAIHGSDHVPVLATLELP